MNLTKWTIRRPMLTSVSLAAVLWLFRMTSDVVIQTRDSTCYDESRFKALSPGMSAEQVERIMGPPFAKTPWGAHCANWQYSRKVAPALYRRRWVIMADGKASEVISEIAGF